MEIKELLARPIPCKILQMAELKKHNEDLKKRILDDLMNFQKKNIIDNIVILGSSGAILSDIFYNYDKFDIDIIYNGNKVLVDTKINHIDVIPFPFLHPNYKKNLVNVGNYQCVDVYNFAISLAAGIGKQKTRDWVYLDALTQVLDWDLFTLMLEEARISFAKSTTDAKIIERINTGCQLVNAFYTKDYRNNISDYYRKVDDVLSTNGYVERLSLKQ